MKRIKLLLILLASTLVMQAQTTYQISAWVLNNNYTQNVPNYPVIVIDSSTTGFITNVAVYSYLTDTAGTFNDTITAQGTTGTLWFMAPDSCGFATIAISYSPNSPSTLATAGLVLCNNVISWGSTPCNYGVNALPVAGIPNAAYFTPTGANPIGGSTYLWDFGDGNFSTQSTPIHTYSQPGTYYYCLQIDSCPPVCDSVTVFGQGGGCDPFFVPQVNGNTVDIFPALLTGQFVAIVDWGDGVQDTFTPQNIPTLPNNISHTYNAPGNYQICLNHSNATLGCNNTHCANVTVGSGSPLQCNAQFVVDTVNSQPGMVYLWNVSSVLGGNPLSTQVSFNWDFGDGTTSTQAFPTHNYTNAGTFAVCLTVSAVDATGGGAVTCTSTYCDTLTVDQNGNLIYKGIVLGWQLVVLDPNTIGVDEDALEEITVYPNPANDFLKLSNPNASDVSYQLFNTNGQLMRSGVARNTEATIEMMDLTSGIYILQVQVEQNQKQFKIVKW